MQNQPALNQRPPMPPLRQFFLCLLTLAWFVVAPISVAVLTLFFPASWSPIAGKSIAVLILAGLLALPLVGLTSLTYKRNWHSLKPFVVALLLTGFYIVSSATIRALAQPVENPYTLSLLSEAPLRLIPLTLIAIGLGGFGLWQTGVPRPHRLWWRIFGFNRPELAGFLLALTVIALLTIGWPITGALGDSWASLIVVIQALGMALADETFFRGAVLGLLTYHLQPRRSLAVAAALLLHVSYTPSLIVPGQDWEKLVMLVTIIPFALLLTELRAQTGSLWVGLLVAWAYRAAPLLFTDPRVELPFLTQPWQTVARMWMVIGAGLITLTLLAVRTRLARSSRIIERQESRPLRPSLRQMLKSRRLIAAAVAVLLTSTIWLGLWIGVGYPGFYDDGFLIILTEQADLSGAEKIADPVQRRAFVREQLVKTANRTQPPIRADLEAAGLIYRSFYLINMIRVDGHHRHMAEFAQLPGVARVMLNPNVRPYPAKAFEPFIPAPNGTGIEWNIRQIKADQVWNLGFTGQGVVVGGQDSGYDWQHPALRQAYRGLDRSGQVDHNYNWHDAWSDSLAPFDDGGHGTHTMGIIVGDAGPNNRIGVAPGARWMGCRNMRRGVGNPASYTDCMEFLLAPYPLNGDSFTDGDVSQAPQVINNSWGCPNFEGCDDQVLEPALVALKAAGIMMVVSAGNDGPACQTATEPPARYAQVLSVGATNRDGEIAGFSSRGPIPGISPLLKPDVTAPGVEIRSCLPNGSYGLADGTSMAGPHVAGLAALLWSARPNLVGHIDETENIIRRSATPVKVTAACPLEEKSIEMPPLVKQLTALNNAPVCACGQVTGTPNDVYGWGQIDALAAVKIALGK